MYTATTQGVEVSVTPAFLSDRSDPDQDQYFWAYTIEIHNRGPRLMQLIARHWLITDGNGKIEEVQGLGVVGEQPVLKPGETFRYTSGCPLTTPTGIMAGTYTMTDEDGTSVEIEIPAFSLDVPQMRRILN